MPSDATASAAAGDEREPCPAGLRQMWLGPLFALLVAGLVISVVVAAAKRPRAHLFAGSRATAPRRASSRAAVAIWVCARRRLGRCADRHLGLPVPAGDRAWLRRTCRTPLRLVIEAATRQRRSLWMCVQRCRSDISCLRCIGTGVRIRLAEEDEVRAQLSRARSTRPRITRPCRSPASARSWIAALSVRSPRSLMSNAQLAGVDQGCDLRHRPATRRPCPGCGRAGS